MKTSIVEYEGDQLEIDFSAIGFDLDRPQLSICPQCSSDIIKLADACPICGWRENQKLLGDKFKKSLAIPCTVKQSKQPELSGVIKQDLGDRFLVEIPSEGSTVTVPKLFVYPDLSPTVRQIDKNPSKNYSPSKTRRRKGEGNGSIYYRTVTRNGKAYQQAYYHWVEGNRKRSKYIPKNLLDRVQKAESKKLPVNHILILLGEKKINPSKDSNTYAAELDSIKAIADCQINPSNLESPSNVESALLGEIQISPSKSSDSFYVEIAVKLLNGSDKSPSNDLSPSKSQRTRGQGSGTVHYRRIKKKGKEYQQAYYHYEIWSRGDRLIKSSKYIPKKMESKIIRMNNEKESVEKILKVLESKSKRKRK